MILIRLFILLSLPLFFSSLQGCAVAAVGAATTGVAMATDRRTAGSIVDDQAIEVKALHALSQKKELWKQSHIAVMSYNNIVLLTGQVPSEEFKREAEATVREIPKVAQIHNELSIGQPVSLGIRSQDSWITTQIKGKLLSTKGLRSNHVKVNTEDGVVYLMGLTHKEEQMTATEISRTVEGVQKVVQIFEHL